ncbi:molybdopterin/thiamine biosynthesis adenylyltransferase [Micromonospora violae]|uniref:Molybdopterin/thiamine biosynthesis adenylyltransferase n=2 Tax=Micromonospora violae TaxID=1278207 RepID=A0A4Q7UNT8_9ACTN|nr:molybdopterin/thiamine biosynthesis adenylyltransferase [Micromonospora violae]
MRQRAQVLVDGDDLLVLMRGRALKTADSVETRWLLTRVCEGVDPVQIAGPATGDRPAITAEVVQSTVADLEAIGALERLDVDHQQTPDDIGRNARTLEFLSTLEGAAGSRFDMHARVARSSVLLIGTGGLGSWIAYGLAAAGIGRLGLCDPDTVDLSNLNRSILFDRDSVGTLKVEAARDRLSRFSPDLRVEVFAERVEGPEDVARIGEGFDLIIGAADRPHRRIRRWVAGGSLRCGVPSLQAGGGRIGPLYIPGETSCAGCLQASLVLPGSRMDVLAEQPPEFPTRSPGSLAPFPAAESGMVVLEAYRYLSKMAPPATVNGYLSEGPNLFDGKRVELNPHPACSVCGTQ